MREDPDNHGGLFDGGNDLQGAATIRAMLDVNVEDALEQPRPTRGNLDATIVGLDARGEREHQAFCRSTRYAHGYSKVPIFRYLRVARGISTRRCSSDLGRGEKPRSEPEFGRNARYTQMTAGIVVMSSSNSSSSGREEA